MSEALTKTFAAAVANRAIAGHRKAESRIEGITDIIRRSWLQLQALIKAKGSRAVTTAKARAILQQMAAATEAAIEPVLVTGAEDSFETAFDIWAEHLPADWWKLAFPDDPETVLLEAKGKSKKKKGKFPVSAPKTTEKKVSKKTAARIKAKIKPKRSATLRAVRSRGWKSRMRKWSKKVTDLDKVAELIADGIEKGKKFETIVNSVRPHVDAYSSSVRRLVRTELAFHENKQLEKQFEAFGEIIEGFQIINPLDERTRPTHAARAGTIYWKDKRKKPNAEDRPQLPDAPNCRCTYAPIFKSATPAELKFGPKTDPRTYAGWFNKQTDETKARVVGKKRWAALKAKSKRPSWFDAVDRKTGRLVDIEKLQKERRTSTASRRKINKQISKRISGRAKKELKRRK